MLIAWSNCVTEDFFPQESVAPNLEWPVGEASPQLIHHALGVGSGVEIQSQVADLAGTEMLLHRREVHERRASFGAEIVVDAGDRKRDLSGTRIECQSVTGTEPELS